MNKTSVLSICAACVALLASAGVSAQQAPQAPLPTLPVDLFICNLKPGNDMAAVQRAGEAFNKWADAKKLTGLTSYNLTPMYHSDELKADTIGMDIWQNGAAMGNGAAAIVSDPKSTEAYDKALNCGAHQLFVLLGIKPPSDGMIKNGSTFQLTNCTLKENRNVGDAIQAAQAWVKAMDDAGIATAQALLVPAAGESSDAHYSFKWLTVAPSVQAFGKSIDTFLSKGLVQTRGNIVGNVMSCDSQRIYTARVVREAPADGQN
jgi:hypothetical protein